MFLNVFFFQADLSQYINVPLLAGKFEKKFYRRFGLQNFLFRLFRKTENSVISIISEFKFLFRCHYKLDFLSEVIMQKIHVCIGKIVRGKTLCFDPGFNIT